ncbi:MAG: prolyl oligopeptidase family serine peptidase [Planctomycetales bacterium]|nr:prolyl oligopeptidase family serine peptidase [Planctomycetales bacterium]
MSGIPADAWLRLVLVALAVATLACSGPGDGAATGPPAPARRAPDGVAPPAPPPPPPPHGALEAAPPRAKAVDAKDTLLTVVEVEVPDPYRWLEDGESPDVKVWAEAQDAYTRRRLDSIPARAALHARIADLASIGRVLAPRIRRDRIFYLQRAGLQNQPVLYVREGVSGEPRVVLDPNAWSPDATVALDWWHPSRDGRLLAYGVSAGGSEESTLKVRDMDKGTDLPDEIPNCRAASVAWLRDGGGFYYARYPAKGTVPKGDEKYHRRIFFHELGGHPASDPCVYGEALPKEHWPDVSLSPDDRWLLVSVFEGWSKSEIYLLDRKNPRKGWVPVVEGVDAVFSAEVVNDRLYILTNEGAPRYRVMAASAEAPKRALWTELVPEGPASLEEMTILSDRIVLRELTKATSRLRAVGLDGKPLGEIPLPTLGSLGGISGEPDGTEAVFDFQSFFVPPALYLYRAATGEVSEFLRLPGSVDASPFEANQVTYKSRDGTDVSMFLVHRKGLRRDGTHPTLLYGYGGFNVSMTPGFGSGLLAWLERGGVYAMPNLRGGGEYGEEWHKAGMLARKQNVFDDYVAAAEWLVRERITRPERLAIMGGSNGGLLVAAALTQRPDLYRAVVCAVPLCDMIRYPRFQLARLWIPEYGDPEDPRAFRWLHAYSPYHRVKEGEKYPAVLLMTGESDTRVDPCHARKMAARLQAASESGLPTLLRVERKAGHGAGKPLSKAIDELADEYAFLLWQLGMEGGAPANR